jgi:CHAT domain-containing protein
LPDEVTSLAGGLLFAGSAGVIGSLWPVSDEETGSLFERFYRHWTLDGDADPAQALRTAQIESFRSADGAQRSSPYYWGGFCYLGA